MNVISIKAGTYWVGDPCYAVKNNDWGELLNNCDYFNNPVGITPNGTRVVAFDTLYGDGGYKDNFGRNYPVDAGLIGIIPLAYINTHCDPDEIYTLGSVVTFEEDTFAQKDGGILRFGNVTINTDDWDEDEDEDDDDWNGE